MSDYRVTAKCRGGHEQVITMQDTDRVSALTFAGLTDGSFPGYVTPPGPDSVIGKCGICGGQFSCTVQEVIPT